MNQEEKYQRFRAPQGNGEILCVPEWQNIGPLLEANRNAHAAIDLNILGFSHEELSHRARSETLKSAVEYLDTYTDFSFPQDPKLPLIVTGHQPQLFHPGVWLKNFSAAKLAKLYGGISLNLIIDNDLCRSTSLQVPTGNLQAPSITHVAMDATGPAVPFEEREIEARSVWNSFGERCRDTLLDSVEEPLIGKFWTEFASSVETKNVGYALAQARHLQELEWNTHNIEIPQSFVCKTFSFRVFCLHILIHAEHFLAAHNESLSEYRSAHKLRNQAQPIPNLLMEGDWIEVPFWFWNKENPQRRALYLRKVKSEIHLSDLGGWEETIGIQDAESAIESLIKLEGQGNKIRTRALTTTLYSRLYLADLFIHGIGGAKYDQVTDSICTRFFGIELPKYLTLSGTLRLPIELQEKSTSSASEIRQKIRELEFHPEKFQDSQQLGAESSTRFQSAVERKRQWVNITKTPSNASERHREINYANQEMKSLLHLFNQDLQNNLKSAQENGRVNDILKSREYSFCLFPQIELQNFLLDL